MMGCAYLPGETWGHCAPLHHGDCCCYRRRRGVLLNGLHSRRQRWRSWEGRWHASRTDPQRTAVGGVVVVVDVVVDVVAVCGGGGGGSGGVAFVPASRQMDSSLS